jgi:hypothetical protein
VDFLVADFPAAADFREAEDSQAADFRVAEDSRAADFREAEDSQAADFRVAEDSRAADFPADFQVPVDPAPGRPAARRNFRTGSSRPSLLRSGSC